MKKIFNIAFTMVLATLTMVSCKKDSLTYDGPVLAHFTAESGSFFVEEEDNLFSVPVGVTKPADTDITLTINILADESTAVEGEDFTIESKQVTIKAGESVGNLVVIGNFANLDAPKTIVFEIESSDINASFNQAYSLTIQRFCPFVRDDFVGLFAFQSEFWITDAEGNPLLDDEGNPLAIEVEAVPDPENENAILFKDLYETGIDIQVIFNASNKSNFVTSVPNQLAWISSAYGNASLAGGTGKFSACDKTLSYESAHTVSAGSFGVESAFFTKID